MKIIRELQVSLDEFYDFLEQDFLTHFSQADKSNRTASELKKGLRYSTQSGNQYTKTDYEVLEYQRHQVYKIRVSTHSESMVTAYYTKPCDKGVQVTFEQEQNRLAKETSNRWLKRIGELLYFGRMSEKLYKIQTEIVRARND